MAAKTTEIAKASTAKIADAGHEKALKVGDMQWMLRMAQISGAAVFADNVANSMNAQAIRGWEMFQQEGGYKAFECKDFVEYLDKFRPNGLTKDKYYARKALLEKEGDGTFDLLNSLNVPAQTRLLLSSGDIEIKEDEIIVGGKAAPIGDKKQIKALFKEISTAFESAEAKATKEKKALHKQMKRAGFVFAKDADGNEIITPPPAQAPVFSKHDGGDEINHRYLVVVAAINDLTQSLTDCERAEAAARLEQYKPALQQAFRDLMTAPDAERAPDAKGGIADLLSDEDLAALAEDDD